MFALMVILKKWKQNYGVIFIQKKDQAFIH